MLPSAASRSWPKSTSKVGTAPPVTSGTVNLQAQRAGEEFLKGVEWDADVRATGRAEEPDSRVLTDKLMSWLPALPRSVLEVRRTDRVMSLLPEVPSSPSRVAVETLMSSLPVEPRIVSSSLSLMVIGMFSSPRNGTSTLTDVEMPLGSASARRESRLTGRSRVPLGAASAEELVEGDR